jgi:uncharacterized linocin/CFP29 family protein
MSNVLRRNLAPLTDDAWQRIDDEVRDALTALLSARRIVDFRGPHGYTHSAESLGRLENIEDDEGLSYGVRSVLPLTEVRAPFSLSIRELENIDRGALEVDLEPARDAAMRLAAFEERFVYSGFEPGRVQGISSRTPHPPLKLGPNADSYVSAVTQAMEVLVGAGVKGPYALVLAPATHQQTPVPAAMYCTSPGRMTRPLPIESLCSNAPLRT